jgi:hypothetical protein
MSVAAYFAGAGNQQSRLSVIAASIKRHQD